MATSYYIRNRGRVLGPYEVARLQQLIRRGQFSRLHEVSPDGLMWVRASTITELFDVPSVLPPADHSVEPSAESHGAGPAAASAASSPAGAASSSSSDSKTAPDAIWYYTPKGGQTPTQTDFAGVAELIRRGELQRDDLLWTQGMKNWVAAGSVDGLPWSSGAARPSTPKAATPEPGGAGGSSILMLPPSQHGMGFDAEGRGHVPLPENLRRASLDMHPWVLFVAIATIVVGCLGGIVGATTLLLGVRAHQSLQTINGIFQLGVGGVILIGGVLLLRYASLLGALRYDSAAFLLEAATLALRRLWIYASMVIVVGTALFLIGLAFYCSMSEAIPPLDV